MEKFLPYIGFIGFILVIVSVFLLINAYLNDVSIRDGILLLLIGLFLLLVLSFYTGAILNAWSIRLIAGIVIVSTGIITFLVALVVLLSDGKNPVVRKKCLGLFLITAMLAVIGDSVCSWF